MFHSTSFLRPHYFEDLIRVGPKSDGGYVIPQFLFGSISSIKSLGICDDWNFESEFIRKSPVPVVLEAYDAAAGAKYYLGRLADRPFKLRRYWEALVGIWRFKKFFNGRDKVFYPKFVHSGPSRGAWENIVKVFEDVDLHTLLKIDIEGWEYDVLREDLSKAGCLVVEFHDIFKFRESFESICNNLSRSHYLAHIHPNNAKVGSSGFPDILELTYVNKALCSSTNAQPNLDFHSPVPGLDFPCRADRPEIPLKFLSNGL